MERGNDVHALVEALRAVKDIDHPIVVHVHTIKGLGFDEAAGDGNNGSDGCNQTGTEPHAGQ